MATVGTFTIIKNEARWIRAHLLSWLCFVDEMVFFDGTSTDGTLEIIKDIRDNHPFGHRITLVDNKAPNDLQEDYVRLFDDCLHTLKTDYAIFAHPDMLLDDPGNIGSLGDNIAYFSHMRSFAGEPDGQLYEIKTGRAEQWKNIYRLRKPDLGLHYFGFYGAQNEDCYFSKITGSRHEFYGADGKANLHEYPYKIGDSGIKILHFSDVRTIERRRQRMLRCVRNQDYTEQQCQKIAQEHPRVTFQDSKIFKFVKCEYPDLLKEAASV